MIRIALATLGTALCISLPAAAQSFSHTHGAQGHHSHDTTIRTVSGSCCQVHTCGHSSHAHSHGHSRGHGHNSHHGHHKKQHGHAAHELHGGKTVTRTYTRTYVHPHRETRVYTRSVPGRVVHRSHSQNSSSHHSHHGHTTHHGHGHGQQSHGMSHDERLRRDYAYAGQTHNDRSRAWAHHDRRWKSRTNSKRY